MIENNSHSIDSTPFSVCNAIKRTADKNGKFSGTKYKKLDQRIHEWFEINTWITPKAFFYLLQNGLSELPFCEFCKTVQLTPHQYEMSYKKQHFYCCAEHASKSEEVRAKINKTWEANSGAPFKRKECIDKRRETWTEKYGVDHPCKTEKVRETQKQTWLEKYGTEHISKAEAARKQIKETHRENLWESRISIANERRLEIISSKENYINGEEWTYKCKDCGNTFSTAKGPSEVRCYDCHPKTVFVSQKETEVANWIRSIYHGNIETSNRTAIAPYELDIYIPDKNLTVEFDGIYWHSEKFKDKLYHQKKSIMCMNKGIRLIHIPELIWDNPLQNNKIRKIIKNALGLSKHKIYARNTQCIKLDPSTYRNFLIENHIQGAISSSHRYGLIYNDTLVAVLGYGKSRFQKGEQELHRFCSLSDYNIVGGFSKLLKYSQFHGVSYIDLTYFNGTGYLKTGFKFIKYTEPNYIWFNYSNGI